MLEAQPGLSNHFNENDCKHVNIPRTASTNHISMLTCTSLSSSCWVWYKVLVCGFLFGVFWGVGEDFFVVWLLVYQSKFSFQMYVPFQSWKMNHEARAVRSELFQKGVQWSWSGHHRSPWEGFFLYGCLMISGRVWFHLYFWVFQKAKLKHFNLLFTIYISTYFCNGLYIHLA